MYGKSLIGLLGVMALSGCVMIDADDSSVTSLPETQVIYDTGASGESTATSGLPFSPAVIVGDLIFMSGTLGIEPGSRTPAPGGVGPETTQIFKNMSTTLARHGADLSDLVKCTVFLEDMADYGAMNAAYKAALPNPKPARSTFGVDGIALGALLEIECIAVKS